MLENFSLRRVHQWTNVVSRRMLTQPEEVPQFNKIHYQVFVVRGKTVGAE
jgi:hypothetical protein